MSYRVDTNIPLRGVQTEHPMHETTKQAVQFDVITGKALYDRNSHVATYAYEVDETGDVVVSI